MKTPRKYQLLAINRATLSNLLLCDDCGIGKTLQAVETGIAIMIRTHQPVLIVCPKSVRGQWYDEIRSQSDLPIIEIDSQFEFQGKLISKPYWVLTHYEAAVKHYLDLAKTVFSLVVIDEAHRIKNRKAQRTKALKKLQSTRKLLLTGTPFNRDPSEYWSLLHFLEPKIFTSYWRFREVHIKVEVDKFGYEHVIGVKDPKSFARLLAPYVLRRTKKDVAPEMPEKIIQHVPVALNEDQRTFYDQIDNVEDQIVQFKDQQGQLTQLQISIVLTKILRLQQASCDPSLLNNPASSAKLEWLIDWLEDHSDQSVIVFTKFKDVAKRLGSSKYFDTCLTGDGLQGLDPKQSTRIVGTIAKMGEALDLPHISTEIFLDREWSKIAMTEAKHIIYLEAQDTVDQLIRQVNEGNDDLHTLIYNFLNQQQRD